MSSLVENLQRDILNSKKPVTEILRTAKVIAAKLNLSDITEWIDREMNGYPAGSKPPEYRIVRGGTLQINNPYQGGWRFAGHLAEYSFGTRQPVHELEELAKQEFTHVPTSGYQIGSFDGADSLLSSLPQRVVLSNVQLKNILEAVKNELLNWAIELEQRGITGDGMSFDKEEKQKAQQQTFNIQNFTGVLGDVRHSNVTIYDYSSIHQALKQHNVPQSERNELENILDELKHSSPEKKQSLIQKGKAWIVKNQDFLGAGTSIVRQALGIPDVV